MRLPWLALPLLLLGCAAPPSAPGLPSGGSRAPVPPAPAPHATSAVSAAAAPASAAPSAAPPRAAPGVPFERDDFEGAQRRAAAAGELLFVDAWAPWCHTCLSMEATVFTQPSLRDYEGRVRFVALDTDRESNAEFTRRFEVEVWPTLFVLEPHTQRVLGYWPGAASLAELRRLLDDALSAQTSTASDDPLLTLLFRGKAAQARGDYRAAVRHYRALLARAGTSWPRRSEALLLLLLSLAKSGDLRGCAQLGLAELDHVEGAATPTEFARGVLRCTGRLDAGQARRGAARVTARLQHIVARPAEAMSADDRADAWALLSEAAQTAGDAALAGRAQRERLAVLEAAAAAAGSPEEAQIYDQGRLGAYLALEQPERALTLLRERETQLPRSYEASARLASLLERLGRREEALEAVERALTRSDGQRRLGALALKARLLLALERRTEAAATLEQEVAGWQALGAERHAERLADAQRRLSAARTP